MSVAIEIGLSHLVNAKQALETPKVVCLCGSTRFWRQFQRSAFEETIAGRIVLSIGAASGTDDEHFGNLPREEWEGLKAKLDALHFRKIELADEVLILNVDGYVGESTARELAYARSLGIPVRWLEPDKAIADQDDSPEAIPPAKSVPRPQDLPVVDHEPTVQRWCPFCGKASVEVVDSTPAGSIQFRYHVSCPHCGCLGPACSTPAAACRWWDMRYIDGKIVHPSDTA